MKRWVRDEIVVLAWCEDDESDVDNEDEEGDSEESKESDDDDDDDDDSDDNKNDDTTGRRGADDAAASKPAASSAPPHSLHKVCSFSYANTHCKDTIHEWFNNPPCHFHHTLGPQRFEQWLNDASSSPTEI